MNLGRSTSKVTIASATYGVALKAAMRLAGAFLKGATTRQTVIILKLPPQADERAYEAAAGRLVKSNPNLLGFLVIRADVTRRGLLDVKTLDDALVLGRPLVILWPLGIKVPIHIVAAADRIVDVRSVRPFHLASAAKEVEGRLLDIGEASRQSSRIRLASHTTFRPFRTSGSSSFGSARH